LALLERFENVKTLHGQRAAVRKGYLPEREVLTPYYAYAQLRITTHLPRSGIQADRGSRESLGPYQRPQTDQAVVGGHWLQRRRTGARRSTGSAGTRRLKSPLIKPPEHHS